MAETNTLAHANDPRAVEYLEAQIEKGERANLPQVIGNIAVPEDDFPGTNTYENIVLGSN